MTPVHVVRPGNLKVTVVRRGIVEPQWTASEDCRVKDGAAICWILPDQTRVMAGHSCASSIQGTRAV